MLKFLLHRIFFVTLHVSDLLCKTSLLRFNHAPSNYSQKHGKNVSQNMRKVQNLQIAPSKPYIKKYPTSFKNPSLYRFWGSDEESQFLSTSGLFLGSNPPSNGQKSSKNPFSRLNISQNQLKIPKNHRKNPLCTKYGLNPPKIDAPPFLWSYNTIKPWAGA